MRSIAHNFRIVAVATVLVSLSGCVATQPRDPAADAAIVATLPPLVIAEPDTSRPRYVRTDWQPHGWADADGDGCNTRKEVLIAESIAPATTHRPSCTVEGSWDDTFAAFKTTDASKLEIDHLVALSDAHRSGGWAWSTEKKIAFANNLDDADALNAMAGQQNQLKSDLGPDGWMPSNKASRCRYVLAYARIKSTWALTVTSAQWKAIFRQWAKCPDAQRN